MEQGNIGGSMPTGQSSAVPLIQGQTRPVTGTDGADCVLDMQEHQGNGTVDIVYTVGSPEFGVIARSFATLPADAMDSIAAAWFKAHPDKARELLTA